MGDVHRQVLALVRALAEANPRVVHSRALHSTGRLVWFPSRYEVLRLLVIGASPAGCPL